MNNSVALRTNFSSLVELNLIQVDENVRSDCYEYLYMDRTETLNDTLRLNCIQSNLNKTITGISIPKSFNGLVSIGLKDRRISSHHFRFIDYEDCKFAFFFKKMKSSVH